LPVFLDATMQQPGNQIQQVLILDPLFEKATQESMINFIERLYNLIPLSITQNQKK
jgi:hypothetical protein